jgi:hypothetical protein
LAEKMTCGWRNGSLILTKQDVCFSARYSPSRDISRRPNMSFKFIAALACITGLIFSAETPADGHDPLAQSGAADLPTLGDIMLQIQLGHFKLGYAGALSNWQLARYEVGQIESAFETAARRRPTLRSGDDSIPSLKAVDAAAAAMSNAVFGKAFERLTTACNDCHASSNVGFIRIKVPTTSRNFLFGNQMFQPE